jgi:DNA-binding transcriptional LysR family regulator
LRPLPLATFTKGCIFNARILDALENEGIPFRLAYQSISHASIFAAVSEGLAATVVARSSVPHGSPLLATGLPLPDIGVIDIAVYGPESVSAATKTVRDSVVAALSCEDEKQRAA